jgi:hypothetical protein
MSFGAALGLIFTMGVIVIGLNPPKAPLTIPDAICMAIAALIIAYGLTPNRDPGSHQGARDGFAFRMGKALKRILYNRRRDTAPRN